MNVEALKRENEQLHRDVQILIAQIEWLQECTGESLEDEDAAMFAQIKSRPGGTVEDAVDAMTGHGN